MDSQADQSITGAIEALRPLVDEGLRPHVDFVLGPGEDGGIWETAIAMGGKPKSTLYIYPDEPPCVIESVEVTVYGVRLHVQRDRIPTAEELANHPPVFNHSSSYCTVTI